ncbi:hypothetical protein ACFLTE_09050 [Bacteroidota bacterium]
MKTITLFFLSLCLIMVSCEKDNNNQDNNLSLLTELNGESGLSYDESLSKWNELKNNNGNSYIYQTTFTSWTGFGSTTELRVEEGNVTSRKYQGFEINQTNGQKEILETYHETSDNLGSNDKGANPLTIDELYETCASEYLIIDENNNTIYFETTENGLMTLCGYVPEGCMDDCLFSVSIDFFDWID